MSSFLGFIHYEMFRKIQFQNFIVDKILNIAKLHGYNYIVDNTNELGVLEEGNLEDIIDIKNIHGWLQERVGLVERKFALVTSQLISENPLLTEEIRFLMYKLGKEEKDYRNPKEAYELINSKFLDGMPCDKAIGIIEEKENLISYKVVTDMHLNFWNKNEKLYWDLRNEYINGVLSNSDYKLCELSKDYYEIRG
ncbi:hypothetical protein [Miniphocaeibacter halophilus]|uniref:Uncharacterized protein n=1 Tax=Miniphocaeibacter halophilus TaxID=2931922 RepID=A0AC61MYR2_9FIRM|nr:hypothetical protein [Miniphocaeibacter halophilus]QQK08268.1 hypothetical protein JFY71_01635 [Miniphocaeibacter halophilus]